jgi:hypothetical protein
MTESRTIYLPVRWWSDEQTYAQRILSLPIARMAFVLIETNIGYTTTTDEFIHAAEPTR